MIVTREWRPALAESNKRRSPRYPVENVQGTLHFNTEARVLNMSLAGVAIEAPMPVRVGRTYSVELRHEDGETVSLSATVVWCHLREIRKNPFGESQPIYVAGLSFTDTLTEKAGMLVRFLEQSAIVTVGQRVTGRFRFTKDQLATVNSQFDFRVKTLSLHGLLLEAELSPQLGALFDIDVFLPDYTFQSRARVAYAKDSRLADKRTLSEVGMEFIDVEASERARLASFIASELQPNEEPPT